MPIFGTVLSGTDRRVKEAASTMRRQTMWSMQTSEYLQVKKLLCNGCLEFIGLGTVSLNDFLTSSEHDSSFDMSYWRSRTRDSLFTILQVIDASNWN